MTDLSWIESRGTRALYIPPDYRPLYQVKGSGESSVRSIEITRSASTSPIATTTIAVRSRTDRIWMTKFSETEFEKEIANGVKDSDTKTKRVLARAFDEDSEHERRDKRGKRTSDE